MKPSLLALTFALTFAPGVLSADSTINATNKHAWGANIGWINFKPDQPLPTDGAVTGLDFVSGKIYAANVGWIDLGNGAPADGQAYSNLTAGDFGVNVASIDTSASPPVATLTGFAYGANIGWINFEQTEGKPRINLLTGEFLGFAYSANCGWISLANGAQAPLETDNLDEGPDTDADMIADPWELEQVLAAGMGTGSQAGDLALLGKTTDSDGDGETDLDEFAADTDPFDATDALAIEVWDVTDAPANNVDLFWSSTTTRFYDVQQVLLPGFAPFLSEIPGAGPITGGTQTIIPLPPSGYIRVIAKPPLSASP